MKPIMTTDLPFPIFRRGKVRDVYDLGEHLLIVATDRISAFDHVLEPGIPDKGGLLTRLSNFWFTLFKDRVPNHVVADRVEDFPDELKAYADILKDRSVLVLRTDPLPVECVARGYLIGSGWKDYQKTGRVCGISLPEGLTLADRLAEPIFTPATKAEEGHDENISIERMADIIGSDLASRLRDLTLDLYSKASAVALEKGIIIADTKLEFGLLDGEIVWIDEAFTSDSSRFWPLDRYRPGVSPPSFDKQFVRDYLEESGWDKQGKPPVLPEYVVTRTREKYEEAFRLLTGS